MARSTAVRSTVMGIIAGVASVHCLRALGSAFVSAARGPAPVVPAALGAAATLGAAAPALAEEEGGLLNFGKIKLGGGFAINLDIPETGIINIMVLIGGLIYLLGPLLSESMASREKEIQTDIDDAVAKYAEAAQRLEEAQKSKSQADEVIAEINASIDKDTKDFEATIQASTNATLEKQAAAAEAALKDLQSNADTKVEAYIQEEAVQRALKELTSLPADKKAKFMDAAIKSL